MGKERKDQPSPSNLAVYNAVRNGDSAALKGLSTDEYYAGLRSYVDTYKALTTPRERLFERLRTDPDKPSRTEKAWNALHRGKTNTSEASGKDRVAVPQAKKTQPSRAGI